MTADLGDVHARILLQLREAEVSSVHSHTMNQYGHETYVLRLRHPTSSVQSHALFKPSVPGDCYGWHRPAMEEAAYIISRALNLDLVPPAVYHRHFKIDGRHFEHGGALMHYVQEAIELSDVPEAHWGMQCDALLSDTRILVRSHCMQGHSID